MCRLYARGVVDCRENINTVVFVVLNPYHMIRIVGIDVHRALIDVNRIVDCMSRFNSGARE